MKKITLLTFTFLLTAFASNAQDAGNALNLDGGYITIPNNTNGSLDPQSSHTIEMWFKPDANTGDQKLFSKITTDFLNGYILGYVNGAIVYELYDKDRNNTSLDSRKLPAGVWTHVAATYKKGGKMKIYLNGELDAERDASGVALSYNTNPLIIGAAGWSTTLLKYTGQLDEVRYWTQEQNAADIRKWMHIDPTKDAVPTSLDLYLKLNESSGSIVDDKSANENDGSIVGVASWVASTAPYKWGALFVYTGPEIGGVFGEKTSYELTPVTLNAVSLEEDESAIIERLEDKHLTSICGSASAPGIDSTSCMQWYIKAQGAPRINMEIDLSGYDLTRVSLDNIVLLLTYEYGNYADAYDIKGTYNNDVFKTQNFYVAGLHSYYKLGFVTRTAGLDNAFTPLSEFNVYPNPSNGAVGVDLNFHANKINKVAILDITGKEILAQRYTAQTSVLRESFDLSAYPSGIYVVRVYAEKGISTKRLIKE